MEDDSDSPNIVSCANRGAIKLSALDEEYREVHYRVLALR